MSSITHEKKCKLKPQQDTVFSSNWQRSKSLIIQDVGKHVGKQTLPCVVHGSENEYKYHGGQSGNNLQSFIESLSLQF